MMRTPPLTGHWPTRAPTRPHQLPQPSARDGGCDFALDPALPGNQVSPVWLPRYNPRLALLTHMDAALADGPLLPRFGAEESGSAASEGRYVHLTALPPANQALITRPAAGEAPIAVVLPLDGLFEDRVETARRLRRALVRGGRVKPYGLTLNRRRRLKLVLRALDGHLAGEDYRAIARGLFGTRVPDDAAWRTQS